MTEFSPLLGQLSPTAEPPEVSKNGFASILGLSPARVSQLITDGLPIKPNGKIDVAAGRRWYEEHTDPDRRKTQRNGHASAAEELKRVQVDRARLELERTRGRLIDRQAAEDAIFARARADRDAWLAWAARAAPVLAHRLAIEPSRMLAELEREVRAQLTRISETPLQEMHDAGDRR